MTLVTRLRYPVGTAQPDSPLGRTTPEQASHRECPYICPVF